MQELAAETSPGRCARAVVEYDGTRFAGSQWQPNARTVQGELEGAVARLTGASVRIRFAGRTDAGVHATGQVISFCMPRDLASGWPGWRELHRRLNATLPRDVAVRRIGPARQDFDPRREAVARVYRYRIATRGRRHPLERTWTLEITDPLDVGAMRVASEILVGEHDFSAFGSDPRGLGRTTRRIADVRIRSRADRVEVTVVANAFLRRMVRSIVAVLLQVGKGRMAPEAVAELLQRGERALHGRAVPAVGLTLERVIYPAG